MLFSPPLLRSRKVCRFHSSELIHFTPQVDEYGLTVACSWPIGSLKSPGFFRKKLSHEIISLDASEKHFGFDDEVSMVTYIYWQLVTLVKVAFNTQCSSQWDSLCMSSFSYIYEFLLITLEAIFNIYLPV